MKFILTLPDDLHKQVKLNAVIKDLSMNEFIVLAIEKSVELNFKETT